MEEIQQMSRKKIIISWFEITTKNIITNDSDSVLYLYAHMNERNYYAFQIYFVTDIFYYNNSYRTCIRAPTRDRDTLLNCNKWPRNVIVNDYYKVID